jgi:predicted DNA-binding transcriptional regulator AlpA
MTETKQIPGFWKHNQNPGQFACCAFEELAELLQVPVVTIYGWRYRREGPAAIRIGRHLRFDPADFSRWLDERKTASSSR